MRFTAALSFTWSPLRPASLQGGIDLAHALVGGWYDGKQTWPATLQLDGFVYEAIDADDVTVGDRLDWLRRHQGGSLPQPYEQVAGPSSAETGVEEQRNSH